MAHQPLDYAVSQPDMVSDSPSDKDDAARYGKRVWGLSKY